MNIYSIFKQNEKLPGQIALCTYLNTFDNIYKTHLVFATQLNKIFNLKFIKNAKQKEKLFENKYE